MTHPIRNIRLPIDFINEVSKLGPNRSAALASVILATDVEDIIQALRDRAGGIVPVRGGLTVATSVTMGNDAGQRLSDLLEKTRLPLAEVLMLAIDAHLAKA